MLNIASARETTIMNLMLMGSLTASADKDPAELKRLPGLNPNPENSFLSILERETGVYISQDWVNAAQLKALYHGIAQLKDRVRHNITAEDIGNLCNEEGVYSLWIPEKCWLYSRRGPIWFLISRQSLNTVLNSYDQESRLASPLIATKRR